MAADETRQALPDRWACAEIKAGRDCAVHGKVHGPTGTYTPPDWEAIVDDAVHEIDQRWGEPVDDDEPAPMDRQIVRETAEAVLRPVVAERDRLRAENEALRQAIGEFLLATVGRRHLKNSDRELLSGALDENGQP